MKSLWTIAGLLASALAVPASATETVRYTYDANGRLVKVERVNSAGVTVQTTYSHDKAGNRVTTATSGSPNSSPPS